MKLIQSNRRLRLGNGSSTIALTLACGAIAIAAPIASAQRPQTPSVRAERGYFTIPASSSVPVASAEVIEFFSYGCKHCADYRPYAKELETRLQGTVRYRLIPVIFNPQWEAYSRAFFAAEILGIQQQSHQELFDDINNAARSGRTLSDLATNVYSRFGVPAAKFVELANSAAVTKKLDQAYRLAIAYGVDQTPTITVNGKYRVIIDETHGITPARSVELAVDLASN